MKGVPAHRRELELGDLQGHLQPSPVCGSVICGLIQMVVWNWASSNGLGGQSQTKHLRRLVVEDLGITETGEELYWKNWSYTMNCLYL